MIAPESRTMRLNAPPYVGSSRSVAPLPAGSVTILPLAVALAMASYSPGVHSIGTQSQRDEQPHPEFGVDGPDWYSSISTNPLTPAAMEALVIAYAAGRPEEHTSELQ